HLTADFHGGTQNGFVLDAIRAAHEKLVNAGMRERISLLGSGGIAAAEHVPKAIICGLDATALDTPLLIALQAQFIGDYTTQEVNSVRLLPFDESWGRQRIMNLLGSWRDQLLEILGAMGLREVRRLRGEMGRAMFQIDLEQEAFTGIPGFEEAGDV
ncbi:MAG: glutamate synthase-related protein, partial [Anaerolineales bacterium]